jgi:PIN domain nuclease of toxin-antitoxin system
MRYYLDTNVLIFFLLKDGNLDKDVENLIDDSSNTIYASSIAINEVLHLYKNGKISTKLFKSAEDILTTIKEVGFEIRPFTGLHLQTYAGLTIAPNHNDPTDHAIISQALSEKITLISSDRKFELYRAQGLHFIYNKR